MSRWKLEVNDDGDEVLIFDESHSLVTWNLEDTDKCCYEILHLVVAAPELLSCCEWVLSECRDVMVKNNMERMYYEIEKVVARAKNETLLDSNPTEIDIDWTTI